MKFIKNHIDHDTWSNAKGMLLGTAILAVLGGMLAFIKTFRDFPIPFWQVLILLIGWTSLFFYLLKHRNKKQSDTVITLQKEQSDAIAKLQSLHARDMEKQGTMRHGDLAKQKEFHEAEIATLSRRALQAQVLKDAEIAELTRKFNELAASDAPTGKEISALKEAHAEEVMALNEEVDNLRESNQNAVQRLTEIFESKEKAKDAEITRLSNIIADLNKKLEPFDPSRKMPLFKLDRPLPENLKFDPYGRETEK